MEKEIELKKLLNTCINNKTIEIDFDFKPSENLINSKCIIWDKDLNLYNINLHSSIVNLELLSIAEDRLNIQFPINISEALKFVDDFEEEIKKPQTNVTWAGLVELKNNLKTYILVKLHNEHNINIIEFLKSLPKKEEKRENHLYSFEDLFFKALPYLEIKTTKLLEVIKENYSINYNDHYIIDLCRNLATKNSHLASDLYELIKSDEFNKFGILASLLLVGLYNNGDNTAFDKAKKLFSDNKKQSISFFARIKLTSIQEIKEVIKITEVVDKNNIESLLELELLLQNLLQNELINNEISEYCFKKYFELFENEDDNLRWRIIHSFSYSIKGYEKERYQFLHFIINKTQNASYVNRYFSNFEDPIYFFDLFIYAHNLLGIKANIDLFKSDLEHFWSSFKEKTELHILEILSNSNKLLRIGVIKLILSPHHGLCHVDLLKLKNEEDQLRALEALTDFPHSIEELLPIILALRNSKFPKVVKYLQQRLSLLIFDAYHEYLYNLILKNIGNTRKDTAFIKPIKKTLETYLKIKELKNSIHDLDSMANEKNLMDLYYRLEHENHAIMMNELKEGKGTFLEHFGTTKIIVRGNSWKADGQNEIRPLAKIQHSAVLDGRAYKNPDLFEHNLNNPKSKF